MKKGILFAVVALAILVTFGAKNFLPAAPVPDTRNSVSSTTSVMPPAINTDPTKPIVVTITPDGGKTNPVSVYFYSYNSLNQIYFTDNSDMPLPVSYSTNDGWSIYTINSANAALTFKIRVTAGNGITHIFRGPITGNTSVYTASYVDNSGDIWAVLTVGDSHFFVAP
jgi:hypothetical protein